VLSPARLYANSTLNYGLPYFRCGNANGSSRALGFVEPTIARGLIDSNWHLIKLIVPC